MDLKSANYLLTDWIYSMKNAEKAARTIKEYNSDVARLFKWATAEGLAELKQEDAVRYKEDVLRNLSVSAMNRSIAAINSFAAFCKADIKLKAAKIARASTVKRLTLAQFQRLIRRMEECGEERLRLVCLALAATGLRYNELKYLTVDACRRKQIEVKSAKGDKYRAVPIPDAIARLLNKYAKEQGKKPKEILFGNRNGVLTDLSQFSKELKSFVGKKVKGMEKALVHAHAFRSLCAINLIEESHNIAEVAALLGHSSIATTAIYLRVAEDKLKDDLNASSQQLLIAPKKQKNSKKIAGV